MPHVWQAISSDRHGCLLQDRHKPHTAISTMTLLGQMSRRDPVVAAPKRRVVSSPSWECKILRLYVVRDCGLLFFLLVSSRRLWVSGMARHTWRQKSNAMFVKPAHLMGGPDSRTQVIFPVGDDVAVANVLLPQGRQV